jgi:predicted HNH restriction endonuclease
MSRIEARKRIIDLPAPSKKDPEEDPEEVSPSPGPAVPDFESDREEMLWHLEKKYCQVQRLPTHSDLNEISGYDAEDYIREFGSIFGAATVAGKTEVDPDEYNHTADGSKQYSEWDLISAIWRLFESTGKASSRMMDNAGPYSLNTYQYRFGSWTDALERAHIEGPEPSVEASRKPRNKYYASAEWQELRSQALERDRYQCKSCGMTEKEHQEEFGKGLNVHHKTDLAEFEDSDKANSLDNLETLCAKCHGQEHPFSKD